MEPFERVQALITGRQLQPLSIRQLAQLGHEAKRRWSALRQTGLGVAFAADAVALLNPEFRLPPDVAERFERALPLREGRIAINFLNWAACPESRGTENPFEPLLEILEHGGSFHPEHSMFLDIYDSEGATCGIVLVQ